MRFTLTSFVALVTACAGAAPPPAQPTAAPGAALERDRQAILAMAGEFRVTFQFAETVGLKPGYERTKPYLSEATELVEVIEDRGDHIVLQHILVLTSDDGGEPRVVKHWRQDWTYEPAQLREYRGDQRWVIRRLEPDERRGRWRQAVYQVDDSPRYASLGRWTHHGGVSSWESGETWRPLPRREYTKRDDYDVLIARNRHTITPAGWVHEQDNAKLVTRDGAPRILTREAGLNVYERVSDVDFSAGRAYWQRTRPFWADVRAAWAALDASGEPVHMARDIDGAPLWQAMFAHAADIEPGAYDPTAGRAFIDQTLDRYLEPARTASR